MGGARSNYGLSIEYVQPVPAGRGDPRAVEATEEDETERGESNVQQLQEQGQLVDRDDWVDESWLDRSAPVLPFRSNRRELDELVASLVDRQGVSE